MNRFLSKFPVFDKHHQMERFGILFVTLILLFVVNIGSIVYKNHNDNKNTLSNDVVYTQTFKLSKSGASGSVRNIYRSTDGTKVFLLLKFDDMSIVSSDAANYQMFITAADLNLNQHDLLSSPSGSIYMFGSTGYMGLYLVDSQGFPAQLLDLVVRSNKTLADSGEVSTEAAEDASFAKYDQFRIYFNPGGANAEIAECLDSDKMTAYDIYESMICRQQEATLRESLSADLKTLQSDLAVIEEYTERLRKDGIQIPSTPEPIAGDTITERGDGTLSYHTNYVLATGFDFDWQNGSIKTGYLEALSNGMTPTQFFDMKSREVDSVNFTNYVNHLDWYYADGTEFEGVSSSGTTMTGIANINNDITNLTNAWTQYYTDKKAYQCTNLKNLLLLEVEAKDVSANYTVNANDGVVTLY